MKEKKKSKSIGLRKKNIGVVRGHQYCQGDGFLVPKNMGWLWNVGICGLSQLRRGWKPGAVRKSVAKIMKEHLTPPAEPAPELANIEQKDPPTLSVKKKQGEYLIVMNPLGMDKELMGLPIVFKIEKSEEGIKRSKARKILKERGVEKTCDCPCIDTCDCLSACEKDRIKFELKCVSKKLCMKSQMTINDVKESSDSEMDMEFTPPSAMKSKNPCRKIPVKFSYAETQYEVQESIPVHETEVADYKTQKSQKTEVKFEGKTKKTLKTKEKSKELKQKTEKAKAIKEKKVGSKKEKLRSATVEKEEK